jgi:hypothetical protein
MKLSFRFVVLNRLVSVGETKPLIMAKGNISQPALADLEVAEEGQHVEKREVVQEAEDWRRNTDS